MPKYKSPDGREFCSMQEAKFDFCATHKCFDCALEKHANEQGESCGYYADCHPDEAARMMGSGKAARVLYSAIMLTVQDQQSYAAGQHGYVQLADGLSANSSSLLSQNTNRTTRKNAISVLSAVRG